MVVNRPDGAGSNNVAGGDGRGFGGLGRFGGFGSFLSEVEGKRHGVLFGVGRNDANFEHLAFAVELAWMLSLAGGGKAAGEFVGGDVTRDSLVEGDSDRSFGGDVGDPAVGDLSCVGYEEKKREEESQTKNMMWLSNNNLHGTHEAGEPMIRVSAHTSEQWF